jgi:2-oxoacid:acceptor oxidoreductase gamma subunit (pyruvate/2-ketoisovalerate family)
MIEIRFHGRGGQGAVVASKVLAVAFFMEGKWAQSFPAFGVERRGAPVLAFTRVDEGEVFLRSYIYEPDQIIVLDPTLVDEGGFPAGLKSDGLIVLNSPHPPKAYEQLRSYRVTTVDASAIAVEHGLGTAGAPIVNSAILGAFARASGIVKIETIMDAVRKEVPAKQEENAAAAMAAYDATVLE